MEVFSIQEMLLVGSMAVMWALGYRAGLAA